MLGIHKGARKHEKMIYWTRVLFIISAASITGSACADTVSDIIKSLSFNPKVKLEHKLSAFDGTLLGFDGGEWGGALVFLNKHGQASQVSADNVKAILRLDNRIFAFSGLAHMGNNHGKIVELIQEGESPPSQRLFADLEGEPSAIQQIDRATVAFQVLAGFDAEGKMASACKLLIRDTASNSITCKAQR